MNVKKKQTKVSGPFIEIGFAWRTIAWFVISFEMGIVYTNILRLTD